MPGFRALILLKTPSSFSNTLLCSGAYVQKNGTSVEESHTTLPFGLYLSKTIIMAKKYKLTGFSRFLVVMLFLIPGAYIGASYYNGEDGIQNIKELVGLDTNENSTSTSTSTPATTSSSTVTNEDLPSSVKMLQNELTDLRRRIEAMERENKELKDQIFDKNEEIVELQRKLRGE